MTIQAYTFQERIAVVAKLVGNATLLADQAGISRRVIGKYLAGDSDPSRERLIAIAKVAGVNIRWLATGTGPMKIDPEQEKRREKFEENLKHLKGTTEAVLEAQRRIGKELDKAMFQDIQDYAFLNNLNVEQIIKLMKKLGRSLVGWKEINTDFLEEIIEAIEEVLEENDLELPASKKASFIRLVYEREILEAGERSQKSIKKTVQKHLKLVS